MRSEKFLNEVKQKQQKHMKVVKDTIKFVEQVI